MFKHSRAQDADDQRKESSVEIGNWLARCVGRPFALPGTWLAIRLGLSAHQVTSAAFIANLLGAGAIAGGTDLGFVVGVVLLQLAYWLDHVDGQVARWNGTASLDGVYFDYLLHHAAALSLGFALSHGLTIRHGDPRWSIAGWTIAGGWLFLGLHNDCRYKAFFQRLKRDCESFQLAPRPAERPSPPSSWPRRGMSAFLWPAFKSCEPHIVLITLSIAAIFMIFMSGATRVFIQSYVLLMAILAPTLAIARWSARFASGRSKLISRAGSNRKSRARLDAFRCALFDETDRDRNRLDENTKG